MQVCKEKQLHFTDTDRVRFSWLVFSFSSAGVGLPGIVRVLSATLCLHSIRHDAASLLTAA